MSKALIPSASLLLAAVLLPISALSARSDPRPPQEAVGIYTIEQARHGAQLYAQNCAMCHGDDLGGTYEIPSLKGRFLAAWSDAPVGGLLAYVSRAMPQMAPGSLSVEDNAAIIAYLLKENGVPAGAKPLANDAEALNIALGQVWARKPAR